MGHQRLWGNLERGGIMRVWGFQDGGEGLGGAYREKADEAEHTDVDDGH
jgi:hypothetical protein